MYLLDTTTIFQGEYRGVTKDSFLKISDFRPTGDHLLFLHTVLIQVLTGIICL